ncbi:hypothetical protein C8J34_104141 [Rhizobium sp. PP-F2F-G36]|nr:hypothetical protein C8J34_104141 [Rhizobium sp. PP-F2F-G36]
MVMYLNNYSWTGNINGSEIVGDGHTVTNSITGSIVGSAIIDGVPGTYTLMASGASLYCISCSNSLGSGSTFIPASTAQSILNLTGGAYRTVRKITHLLKSDIVGETKIEGTVQRVAEDSLKITATVTARYEGPVNITKVSDYVLPVNIGNGSIKGNYIQYLSIAESDDFIVNFVEATYDWESNAVSSKSVDYQQSLGIYFREVSEVGFASGPRSLVIKALGNNTPPTSELSVSSFTRLAK